MIWGLSRSCVSGGLQKQTRVLGFSRDLTTWKMRHADLVATVCTYNLKGNPFQEMEEVSLTPCFCDPSSEWPTTSRGRVLQKRSFPLVFPPGCFDHVSTAPWPVRPPTQLDCRKLSFQDGTNQASTWGICLHRTGDYDLLGT